MCLCYLLMSGLNHRTNGITVYFACTADIELSCQHGFFLKGQLHPSSFKGFLNENSHSVVSRKQLHRLQHWCPFLLQTTHTGLLTERHGQLCCITWWFELGGGRWRYFIIIKPLFNCIIHKICHLLFVKTLFKVCTTPQLKEGELQWIRKPVNKSRWEQY